MHRPAALPQPTPLPRQSRLLLRHAAEPRDEPDDCAAGVREQQVLLAFVIVPPGNLLLERLPGLRFERFHLR